MTCHKYGNDDAARCGAARLGVWRRLASLLPPLRCPALRRCVVAAFRRACAMTVMTWSELALAAILMRAMKSPGQSRNSPPIRQFFSGFGVTRPKNRKELVGRFELAVRRGARCGGGSAEDQFHLILSLLLLLLLLLSLSRRNTQRSSSFYPSTFFVGPSSLPCPACARPRGDLNPSLPRSLPISVAKAKVREGGREMIENERAEQRKRRGRRHGRTEPQRAAAQVTSPPSPSLPRLLLLIA